MRVRLRFQAGISAYTDQLFRAPCITQNLTVCRSHLESCFRLCGIQIWGEVRRSITASRLLSSTFPGVTIEPCLAPLMRPS